MIWLMVFILSLTYSDEQVVTFYIEDIDGDAKVQYESEDPQMIMILEDFEEALNETVPDHFLKKIRADKTSLESSSQVIRVHQIKDVIYQNETFVDHIRQTSYPVFYLQISDYHYLEYRLIDGQVLSGLMSLEENNSLKYLLNQKERKELLASNNMSEDDSYFIMIQEWPGVMGILDVSDGGKTIVPIMSRESDLEVKDQTLISTKDLARAYSKYRFVKHLKQFFPLGKLIASLLIIMTYKPRGGDHEFKRIN